MMIAQQIEPLCKLGFNIVQTIDIIIRVNDNINMSGAELITNCKELAHC